MSSLKPFLLGILLCGGLGLTGQSQMMLYNFDAVPQSLHTNPAMPQQTKVWIGLPVISGVSAFYHNSGFSAADVFAEGTEHKCQPGGGDRPTGRNRPPGPATVF